MAARSRRESLASEPIEALVGAENVEVRPHGVNKGTAYERVLQGR